MLIIPSSRSYLITRRVYTRRLLFPKFSLLTKTLFKSVFSILVKKLIYLLKRKCWRLRSQELSHVSKTLFNYRNIITPNEIIIWLKTIEINRRRVYNFRHGSQKPSKLYHCVSTQGVS